MAAFRFILLSLTLLGFALRWHQLGGPSLWFDELLQLDIAQDSVWDILGQLPRHSAQPLDYIISHFWLQLGRQESWVRFPALVFGTLSIPLAYQLGRRFFNPATGLITAALLTLSSFSLRYSQEVRPYALLLMLILLGYLGLWRAYHTQGRAGWLQAGFGFIGASLSHYFALFALLPVVLWVLIHQFRQPKLAWVWKNTLLFGAILCLLGSSYLITGRVNVLYTVGYQFANSLSQPESLTQASTAKPNRGSGPPVSRHFFANSVLAPLATPRSGPALLYASLFLLGILSLLKKEAPRRAILLLAGWVILPILLTYLFLLHRGTFYAVRYIIYTLPPFLVLVAWGGYSSVRWLNQRLGGVGGWVWASLICLMLLSAEVGDLHAYFEAPAYEDWRSVSQLLARNAHPEAVVIAFRAEATMNWYYPPAQAEQHHYSHADNLWQAVENHPQRWFVLSSYSRRWDDDVRRWLNEQGAVQIGIDRRVVVYVQDERLSREELLAEVSQFDLPAKALTYRTLARQLAQQGQQAQAEAFYAIAERLSD